ncbi:MAG: hydrogenobyrinic acid a,c-diamide synthase (glutamine-hydrolyzing) [Spirochaetota bacterium]|nr:hydrogenobyrinic acid a,c-diamide synthase (glutamine-hydrolyzing) [Spirochaetota bacterium]
MSIPRFVISATQRSSGKTTVSIGLTCCLIQNGLRVQTFKKGPDYIDSMWLKAASGRDCYNLDQFMMGDDVVISSFKNRIKDADIAIIEGNMGLHDAMNINGSGSTAHLAKTLKSPVILVINAEGMNRGIAPLVMGYQQFDRDIQIIGVILNRVKSIRHEAKLKNALQQYCAMEVFGAIPYDTELQITERHLGLIPIEEEPELKSIFYGIEKTIREYINIERVIEKVKEFSNQGFDVDSEILEINSFNNKDVSDIKIGIARDRAFNFYYPENLEALENCGAKLIPFDTINDSKLPDVDAIYIGGGFPEVFMNELENNFKLRHNIKNAIDKGMPVYAECGGLMYLSKSIFWKGKIRQMVGGIPCSIEQTDKPKGLGYVTLFSNGSFMPKGKINAHEFHYSKVVSLKEVNYICSVERGFGIDGKHDGLIYKNVIASYAHLHSNACPKWAESFIRFIKKAHMKL